MAEASTSDVPREQRHRASIVRCSTRPTPVDFGRSPPKVTPRRGSAASGWTPLFTCCLDRDRLDEEPGAALDESPASAQHFQRRQLIPEHSAESDIQTHYDFEQAAQQGQIGKGACGVVFAPRHRITGKVRAVKCVSKKKIKLLERFRREIEIMKRLAHPNLCQLIETFEDASTVFIVMEHVPGGDLFDRLATHKRLSESQAARVMKHIFVALAYLHHENVLHRDLKPENILLVHEEDPGQGSETLDGKDAWDLKIIDWGYASWCGRSHQLKTVCGTAYYIAPEVLGRSYRGTSADMWSAGVILYCLLAGHPPFRTQDEILEGDYSDAGFGAQARDLLSRVLQVDPSGRLTAPDALCHPFVRRETVAAAPVRAEASASMDRAEHFHRSSLVRRAILTVLAMNADFGEVQSLRERFLLMDTDKNGVLDKEELRKAINDLRADGLWHHPTSAAEILEGMDTNASGTVDYIEFVAATLDIRVARHEKELKSVFSTFDQNGDGVIDQHEFPITFDKPLNYDDFKKLLDEHAEAADIAEDFHDSDDEQGLNGQN